MTTMDLKCISWVGDFYQNFETKLLEVQETVYQDTVRYFDQTVTPNVKKFLADVKEDLLPLSPMDPETIRGLIPDLSLIPVKSGKLSTTDADHVDIEVRKLKNELELTNSESEQMMGHSRGSGDGDIDENPEAGCSAVWDQKKPLESTSFNFGKQVFNGVVEGESAEIHFSTIKYSLTEDSSNRQDSELRSSDIPRLVSPAADWFIEELACNESFSEIEENLGEVRCAYSELAVNLDPNDDGEGGLKNPEDIVEDKTPEDIVEDKTNVDDVEGNEAGICSSGNMSAEFGALSVFADEETNNAEGNADLDCKEHFVPEIESSTPLIASTSESCDAAKIGVVVKSFDEEKLAESCVIVERIEPSFEVPVVDEQKSYKKKIREVFSPRKWSKGKACQEGPSVCNADVSGKPLVPDSTNDASLQNSQSIEYLDSEWELL